MHSVCSASLDPNKTESLVYTILQVLERDASIQSVLYGNAYIDKRHLKGSLAHPCNINLPALILGLLYQLHQFPAKDAEPLSLKSPKCRFFSLVEISDTIALNPNELSVLLQTNDNENIADAINNNARYLNQYQPDYPIYPLTFQTESQTLSALPDSGNIWLYGDEAIGKTTYLRQYAHDHSAQVNLYLSLSGYQPEIRSAFHPEHPCTILLRILLNYRFQNAYQTYEMCAAHETESVLLTELSALDELFTEAPDQQQYCLILDEFHDIPFKIKNAAMLEIASIMKRWENVRFIISGRMNSANCIQGFQAIQLCGIADSVLTPIIKDISDSSVRILMKSPLFLNIYQAPDQSVLRNRAAFLDEFFHKQSMNTTEDGRFLLQFVIPFAAFQMAHNWTAVIKRADMSDAVRKAIAFYFDDERVYQNYTAPQGFNRENKLSADRYTELAVSGISFLVINENAPHQQHFTQRSYRDYFAAKHIVSLIDALDLAYGLHKPEELESYLRQLQLSEIWFSDTDTEIYRMIGELMGDDLNRPCEDYVVYHTKLELLLDWAREINTFRLTENIILTMAASRGNVICEADFRSVKLPMWIPAYIKFSDKGMNSSRFEGCKAFLFGLYDGDIKAKYSADHLQIFLHWTEDRYTAAFDLSDYTMTAEYYYDDAFEGVPISEFDEQTVKGIFRNLPHFRNCSFEQTVFLSESSRLKEYIYKTAPDT